MINKKIKIYIENELINIDSFKLCQETFFLVPYLSDELYSKVNKNIGWRGESNYTKLRFTTPIYEKINSLEECDFAVFPDKFSLNKEKINKLNEKCIKANKKLICFENDDFAGEHNLNSNIILFRTSVCKSKLKENERIFPVLVSDLLDTFNGPNNKNIGYVGSCAKNTIRYNIIKEIESLFQEDFNSIYRDGFYPTTNNYNINTTREFLDNIKTNRYTLCPRGVGNFSYRFYETLSLGRIPILIDTDCELPLKNKINWEKHIIFIKQDEIKNLKQIINEDDRDCFQNRLMWEKYLSPSGYFKNFIFDI